MSQIDNTFWPGSANATSSTTMYAMIPKSS
jgi:hypothetical protein